jgi:hypothetical protein
MIIQYIRSYPPCLEAIFSVRSIRAMSVLLMTGRRKYQNVLSSNGMIFIPTFAKISELLNKH